MTNIGYMSGEPRAPTNAQQRLTDLNKVREYAGLPANKDTMRLDVKELRASGHPKDIELAHTMEVIFELRSKL